ncbi:MAG: TetR family transcriptional regulator [Oligoflexia bacterium]|nr:TetR family transcriptional regulator [Oligoflexia bacterium]
MFEHFRGRHHRDLDASTRVDILEAAQRVFAKVGFKEATVRQICREAGVNVCSISYYFGGKEELYLAVFEYFAQMRLEMMKTFTSSLEQTPNQKAFQDKIAHIVAELYKELKSKPDIFKLMHQEIAMGLPRAKPVVEKYMIASQDLFKECFVMGQAKGFVRKDLNAKLMAGSLMHMVIGFLQCEIINPHVFLKGPEVHEDLIKKTVTEIFFNGVLG